MKGVLQRKQELGQLHRWPWMLGGHSRITKVLSIDKSFWASNQAPWLLEAIQGLLSTLDAICLLSDLDWSRRMWHLGHRSWLLAPVIWLFHLCSVTFLRRQQIWIAFGMATPIYKSAVKLEYTMALTLFSLHVRVSCSGHLPSYCLSFRVRKSMVDSWTPGSRLGTSSEWYW